MGSCREQKRYSRHACGWSRQGCLARGAGLGRSPSLQMNQLFQGAKRPVETSLLGSRCRSGAQPQFTKSEPPELLELAVAPLDVVLLQLAEAAGAEVLHVVAAHHRSVDDRAAHVVR